MTWCGGHPGMVACLDSATLRDLRKDNSQKARCGHAKRRRRLFGGISCSAPAKRLSPPCRRCIPRSSLQLRREVSKVFCKNPLASVFKLSAFSSAATSSRKDFLCRPFPTMFSSNEQYDYDDLCFGCNWLGAKTIRISCV